MHDLIIIGGGAAGIFAAVNCAEWMRRSGKSSPRILVLEKSSQPLGKVLISGGGRCNLTHACYDPALLVENYPRGGTALKSAFSRFQPSDTVRWYEKRGVALKTESDGRIFPTSDSSRTVVDCLLNEARQAGVEIRTNVSVEAVKIPGFTGNPFQVRLFNKGSEAEDDLLTRNLLLATGSDHRGLRLAAAMGHTIEPPVPSLFTFKVHDTRLEGLAGIAVPVVRVKLLEADGSSARAAHLEQEGALLVTHWGFSGPVILRLSAWGARWLHERRYHVTLQVNWLRDPSFDETAARLMSIKNQKVYARQTLFAHSVFPELPQRLWKRLLQAAGIQEGQKWGDLTRLGLRNLAQQLTQGRFEITGKGPFKDEFVTCGGVLLDEVDFKTMQSKHIAGLYFAGEILDIDGLTGGFNFQNAWTTGWIAGKSAADNSSG